MAHYLSNLSLPSDATNGSNFSEPFLTFNQALARHLLRLWDTHNLEDGGSHVAELAVSDLHALVLADIYARNGVERVGCVGSSVRIDGVVAVAMVGNDEHLIVASLGSLNYIVAAEIDGLDSLPDGWLDTCMTYHVAIGEVAGNEVVLLRLDSIDELVLHDEGRHLGLQIVGSNLG